MIDRLEEKRATMTPGTMVRVVGAIDIDIYNVSSLIGRLGKVVRTIDRYPCDVLVRMTSGATEAFWIDELQPVLPHATEPTP